MIYATCAALVLLVAYLLYLIVRIKTRLAVSARIVDDLSFNRDEWANRAGMAERATAELANKLRTLQHDVAEMKAEAEPVPDGIRFVYDKFQYGALISIAPPTCSLSDSFRTFEDVKYAALKVLQSEYDQCSKRLEHLKSSNTYKDYAKGAS